MSIPAWKVLLFFAVFVTATALIFPTKRDMMRLYLRSGELEQAREAMDEALNGETPDFEILVNAAQVEHLAGHPDRAIELLRRADEQKPRNLMMLDRLGQYLEWNLRPLDAAAVYERILAITPQRPDLLVKVIGFYRYFGKFESESRAVARMVPLLRTPRRAQDDALYAALTAELGELSRERLADGPKPLRDFLLQRLYVLTEQYAEDWEGKTAPDTETFTTYALEDFLKVGEQAEAEAFAVRLDGGRSLDNQLLLSQIMRWMGMGNEAVDWLERLAQANPGNERVGDALAEAAIGAGDPGATILALQRLTGQSPSDASLWKRLADAYADGGRYAEALDTYKELLRTSGDPAKSLQAMLTAAIASGDRTLMAGATREAERLDAEKTIGSDDELLRLRARLHLDLDEPGKAYALLHRVVLGGQGTPDDMNLLLETAEASSDPALSTEALQLAVSRRPDDPDLLRRAAEDRLGRERTAEALQYLRPLARITGAEADALYLLEIAGYTSDKATIVDAAAFATKLHPRSYAVTAKAGEVLLWVEDWADAAPYLERAALLSDGDRKDVLAMLDAASSAGDRAVLRRVVNTAQKLRPNDPEVIAASTQLLAEDGDAAKAAAYLRDMVHAAGDNPALLRRWAAFADENGLSEQAYSLYSDLLRRDPGDPELRAAVVRLAEWTERPDVAARMLARMSDERPQDADLARRAAIALEGANRAGDALAYYERLLKLRPRDRSARLAVARGLIAAGDYERAAGQFEALSADGPLEQEDRYLLAEAYVNSGRAARALDFLLPIPETGGVPPQRGLLLLTALNAAGRKAEAESLLERLERENAADRGYLARLGAAAYFADLPRVASRLFDTVLADRNALSDATYKTALKGRALVAEQLGNDRRAIESYGRYLAEAPGDADAHYRLAGILSRQGRGELATREYDKALKLVREHPEDRETAPFKRTRRLPSIP